MASLEETIARALWDFAESDAGQVFTFEDQAVAVAAAVREWLLTPPTGEEIESVANALYQTDYVASRFAASELARTALAAFLSVTAGDQK